MLSFHYRVQLLQRPNETQHLELPLLPSTSYSPVQAVAAPGQRSGARTTGSSLLSVSRPERAQEVLYAVEEDGFDEEGDEDEGGGGGSVDYEDEDEDESPAHRRFRKRVGEEQDYDKDPEFAEILGSCLDDPKKARSKMEERVRRKRNKILQTKTGSAKPMKITFNK